MNNIWKYVLGFFIALLLFGIFIHLILPLIVILAIVGGIYYLYKKHQKGKYTPEGRKKVN
ncbi:hypothetical protein COSHB9_12950 [Companilactobacillus alimentarius]|uniref:Uncharacterized protein n=1 Tax=Companilactobacillus alimentarius DSM 20249 TaxID=1423720 RepID=A0A2K9HFF6_9LACO|nr:hypothetical protein [Companilactobacillus alimentarius]AUI71289.1 hypothetical protein LA20249_03335 [Companilactobacillus alimentarius DSM 20249]KRK75428.1 hypothetical protein FC67_GL001946 [Companilactobacillus alimentarius DSM 20249]MDT6951431.1 hypothetical protein [Companilactobacillus alimentarius]GEO43787.1 hypothetical protein LAL01_00190 [Companilactobacillus alimentarius]